VGDGEALDGDIADHPAGTSLELLDDGRDGCLFAIRVGPVDCRGRDAGEVDGDGLLFAITEANEAGEACDVIRVFVGDKNSIKVFGRLTDFGKTARQFLHA